MGKKDMKEGYERKVERIEWEGVRTVCLALSRMQEPKSASLM